MKDFTLSAFKHYFQTVKSSFPNILRFDKYLFSDPKPESFFLIRHDVDRRPKKALQMAELENKYSGDLRFSWEIIRFHA
jgi:hypothetical protein